MPRPIPTLSPDTDAAADRVQMALLRSATPARRASLALSLTATVVGLARHALAGQDPAATEEEIGLRFVELSYGREIAAELAAFVSARRS
jgi:hypothetical protein